MKTCKICDITKPLTEFHKDKSKVDGLNFYCKPCHIKKQKEYMKKGPKNLVPRQWNKDGKKCSRCKEVKPITEFHKSTLRYDGLDNRCKKCSYELHDDWRRNNLDKVAAGQRAKYAKDPERFKDYEKKRNYGMSSGDFASMLIKQNNKCAICCSSDPGGKGAFHVDHCHASGIIRGLLCHNCNVGLGHFKSNPEFLQQAVRYLFSAKRRIK